MEVETIARRWGSSIGVVLPKSVVEGQHIKENDKVIVNIKRKVLAKDIFGILPGRKKSAQQSKEDMRKGW